jgi:hypothetical protein
MTPTDPHPAQQCSVCPPDHEFIEIDAAIPIEIDLIECDLTLLSGHVLVHLAHEAEELPERQPSVAIEVVEVESFTQASALPGSRPNRVQRGFDRA